MKRFFVCFVFVLVFSLPVAVLAATTVGNNVSVGGTLTSTGLFTPTGGISTSTLDAVVIGGSTKAAGSFTTLTATGLITGSLATTTWYGSFTTSTLDAVVIGGSTKAAGSFTSLTVDTNLTVDTDTLFVNASTNKVGVVSSTPFGQLSIGAGGAVSSTISVGKFCMFAGQEDGTNVYVILGKNQPNNQPFATTTVSCF